MGIRVATRSPCSAGLWGDARGRTCHGCVAIDARARTTAPIVIDAPAGSTRGCARRAARATDPMTASCFRLLHRPVGRTSMPRRVHRVRQQARGDQSAQTNATVRSLIGMTDASSARATGWRRQLHLARPTRPDPGHRRRDVLGTGARASRTTRTHVSGRLRGSSKEIRTAPGATARARRARRYRHVRVRLPVLAPCNAPRSQGGRRTIRVANAPPARYLAPARRLSPRPAATLEPHRGPHRPRALAAPALAVPAARTRARSSYTELTVDGARSRSR